MSNPSTSAAARTTTAENFFDLVESHGSMLAMVMLWLFPVIALVLGLTSL
jgi:hypothetical protein